MEIVAGSYLDDLAGGDRVAGPAGRARPDLHAFRERFTVVTA